MFIRLVGIVALIVSLNGCVITAFNAVAHGTLKTVEKGLTKVVDTLEQSSLTTGLSHVETYDFEKVKVPYSHNYDGITAAFYQKRFQVPYLSYPLSDASDQLNPFNYKTHKHTPNHIGLNYTNTNSPQKFYQGLEAELVPFIEYWLIDHAYEQFRTGALRSPVDFHRSGHPTPVDEPLTDEPKSYEYYKKLLTKIAHKQYKNQYGKDFVPQPRPAPSMHRTSPLEHRDVRAIPYGEKIFKSLSACFPKTFSTLYRGDALMHRVGHQYRRNREGCAISLGQFDGFIPDHRFEYARYPKLSDYQTVKIDSEFEMHAGFWMHLFSPGIFPDSKRAKSQGVFRTLVQPDASRIFVVRNGRETRDGPKYFHRPSPEPATMHYAMTGENLVKWTRNNNMIQRADWQIKSIFENEVFANQQGGSVHVRGEYASEISQRVPISHLLGTCRGNHTKTNIALDNAFYTMWCHKSITDSMEIERPEGIQKVFSDPIAKEIYENHKQWMAEAKAHDAAQKAAAKSYRDFLREQGAIIEEPVEEVIVEEPVVEQVKSVPTEIVSVQRDVHMYMNAISVNTNKYIKTKKFQPGQQIVYNIEVLGKSNVKTSDEVKQHVPLDVEDVRLELTHRPISIDMLVKRMLATQLPADAFIAYVDMIDGVATGVVYHQGLRIEYDLSVLQAVYSGGPLDQPKSKRWYQNKIDTNIERRRAKLESQRKTD
jgi:hypothetical protein